MVKLIISTTVGALILFLWSAISWMALPIHHQSLLYTPAQDTILKIINNNIDKSGTYMLPAADNRDVEMWDPEYEKENQRIMEENQGKPFAMIFYVKEGMQMDARRFIVGYVFECFSVLIAVIILLAAGDKLKSFYMRWWIVMLLAVIICIEGYLMNWNWMSYPWHYIKGSIVDQLIGWGLCGIWLAWYLHVKGNDKLDKVIKSMEHKV